MPTAVLTLDILAKIIGFSILSCILAFAWSPALTFILYKYKITRRDTFDPTLGLESRKSKANVPVMGGILIIATVAVITMLANWSRSFTWVPVGVMLLSALLGGVDDLLNIFGKERRSRKLKQVFTLIRIHRDIGMRIWYAITLPWSIFKRASAWLSKHPGKGIHVHEKLFLQFAAGSLSAWWVYYKLGSHFREIYIPFTGNYLDIGWLLIPLIIFIVMFTANAVNIADGMDGLAGGMLIPTFSALALLSWIYGYDEIAILNGTVLGALITYTYFNIKPARFQMGDVGSLGLGALLAINAIVVNQIAVLFFLGFMFYIEAVTVLIQVAGRYIVGRRIFKMAPIHHHFELLGWSEEKIVMRFWIIHLAFVFLGVWIALH
ncbi:MAG: phospho-N-acetylmuramoyl-pentapeptide-transferase [Candidatus Taylorbacteria bacterium]